MLATNFYNVVPVQAADEAIPASHHVGNLLIQLEPGQVADLTWNDVADAGEPLGDDIVGVTVALLSGSVRHAAIGEAIVYGLEDEGVDGTEARIKAPANIVLTSGWTEQFEVIGSEPALLMVHAYVPDAGFAESAAPVEEE